MHGLRHPRWRAPRRYDSLEPRTARIGAHRALPAPPTVMERGRRVDTIGLGARPSTTFGRSEGTADVKLLGDAAASISRRHATFLHGSPSSFPSSVCAVLIDHDSVHGTFVGRAEQSMQRCPAYLHAAPPTASNDP